MRQSFLAAEPDEKKARALTALALIVFATLVSVCIGTREFWIDETITAGHVRTLANTQDAYHPSGYYLLLYLWTRAFGASDLALRAFSVPWALLCFGVLAELAKRALGRWEAVLGLWLFALSPFVVLYFRMARFYSLNTAVGLLVAYCAVLVIQEGKWRHWLGLALAAGAMVELDYIGTMVLMLLYAGLTVLAVRRKHVARAAVSAIPFLALLAVSAATVLQRASALHDFGAREGGGSLAHLALRLLLPPFALAVGETTDTWRLYITGPAILAAAAGAVAGFRLRGAKAGYDVVRWGWPVTVLVSAGVLSTVARSEPLSAAARSALFTAPLAYLVIAGGLCALRGPRLRVVAMAAMVLANLYGLVNYFAGEQFLNPGFAVPWREVARTIEAQRQPGDLIISFYDTSILRYAKLPGFIYEWEEQSNPEQMQLVREWSRHGGRVWLIARDRGSALSRRLTEERLADLTKRAARTETLSLMPYSALDRKVRSFFLRREVPEAYLTLTLLTPPGKP